MQRKQIIALILIALTVIMIVDFKVNNENVLADFFMQFETESMQSITNVSNINFDSQKPSATYKSNFNYDAEDINNFNFDNDIGSVEITGHSDQEIDVVYEIKVFSNSKEAAENYLKDIKVEYNVRGDQFDVFVERLSPKPSNIRGYEVDFTVKIPERLYVNLENKYGNTKISNFNNGMNVNTKYSFTSLNQVKGNVKVRNDYGSLDLDNLSGDININTSYNKNSIKNIEGSLNISSDYTQNFLKDIKADIYFKGRYGGGNIKNIGGTLNVDVKYLGLTIDEITGKISGEMEYGEVNIESLSNELDLKSRYCDLNIRIAKEFQNINVDVNTNYADISSDLGLPIVKEGNTKNISGILGDGNKQLKIDGSYADIKLIYEN